MTFPEVAEGFRSGFACFVGRPNAGKSTLTNAVVGTKVAITSSKPQTTRTVVRGIVHRPDAQLILVDTPGGAEAASTTLQGLARESLVVIHDAAVVEWEEGKNKPKTRQLNNLAGAGALGGATSGPASVPSQPASAVAIRSWMPCAEPTFTPFMSSANATTPPSP